jgi:hypothetical protein
LEIRWTVLRIEARWSFFLFFIVPLFFAFFFFVCEQLLFFFLLIAALLEFVPLEDLCSSVQLFFGWPAAWRRWSQRRISSAKCPLQRQLYQRLNAATLVSGFFDSRLSVSHFSPSAALIWTETFPRRQSHNAILRAAGRPPGRRPF